MKIIIPNTSDENARELVFNGQGKSEGSFTGVVPMDLLLAAGYHATSEKVVSITSSTSVNRRGVRSAVIKVSMPYSAILPDGNGAYTSDAARSGAEFSMHVVIALPSTMTTDIRGTDAVLSKNAEAQVMAAGFILSALLQGLIATQTAVDALTEDQELCVIGGTPTPLDDPGFETLATVGDNKAFVQLHPTSFLLSPVGFQKAGTLQFRDAAHYNQPPAIPGAIHALIGRVARGLPALAGSEDVKVPVVKIQGTASGS